MQRPTPPQTPADDPWPDGPGDSSFLRAFASTWLGLSAVAAAAAILLDPLGVLGTGVYPSVTAKDRDEKAAAYLRREPKPEVVIFGSSHVFAMLPGCVTELTGAPAFNFGVSAAQVPDYVALFRLIQDKGHGTLRRLILGVDPEAFNAERDEDALLQSVYLRPYTPERPGIPWGDLGSQLLSREAAWASLKSVRHNWLGWGASVRYYRDDGAPAGATNRRREEPADRHLATRYRSRYRNFRQLEPERVDAFSGMLQDARQAGVLVDAFLPPLHPQFLTMVSDKRSISSMRENTVALLKRLADDGLLRYHALDSVESFGGSPDEFLDGEHMAPRNANRLLEALIGHKGCAVQ